MVNTNRLKAAIAKMGFTQQIVASEINISPQSLNSKIRNKTEFTVDEAYKLCELLKLTRSETIEIFFAKN